MSKINDGGAASPYASSTDHLGHIGPGQHFPELGMSLRDYFAGQALVGMMQSMRPYSNNYERSAKDAYAQADAMIEAREVTNADR